MDLRLAKTALMNDVGGTSVITFKKGQKMLCNSWEKEKNVKETTLQTPTSVKKEEVLQAPEQRVMQAALLQPNEEHSGADTNSAAHGRPSTRTSGCALKAAAACGKPMQEQAPSRSCRPRREAAFLARPVTPWGAHHWSSVFPKAGTLWEVPT